MARLQKLVECLAAALAQHATAALARLVPFETSLLEVARSQHRATVQAMTPADLRVALREVVSGSPETVELAIQDGIAAIRPAVPEDYRPTLASYLELLP